MNDSRWDLRKRRLDGPTGGLATDLRRLRLFAEELTLLSRVVEP